MLCPSRERRENEWTGDGAFRGIGAVEVVEAGSKPRGGVEGKGDDVAGIGALRGIWLGFGVGRVGRGALCCGMRGVA